MIVVVVDGTSMSRRMKGVGRYAWQLCDALLASVPANSRLLIILFDDAEVDFGSDANIEILRTSSCSEFWLGMVVIPRLLAEHGATVFIQPADKISRNCGVRTLTVCHDINSLIWDAQGGRSFARKLVDRCWEFLRVRGMRRSELVLCNSEFTRERACHLLGIRPQQTAIGYCGVDSAFLELGPTTGLTGDEANYVLAFATGDEREGFDVLPDLFASMVQTGYPGVLVVAGVDAMATYSEALRRRFELVGVLDRVRFLPFIAPDESWTLRELYAGADFYLETSRHEGFGMQLVEALACGTTCFSSDRGALREVGGGYPLWLDIDRPAVAGQAVSRAWADSLHERDNGAQVCHVSGFDWLETRRIVTDFAWDSRMTRS